MTDSEVCSEIHYFHDEWSDGDIFESITLSQEIERYKIDKNTDDIPFPDMRIIRPNTKRKITNGKKNASNKSQPQSDMHRGK